MIDDQPVDLADRVFLALEQHLDAVSAWENEGGAAILSRPHQR